MQPCHPLDNAWRVCVAIGAIPAIATWYLRTKLPETPRCTVHLAKDNNKAEADVAAVLANSDEFRKREKAIEAPKTGFIWSEFNGWILQRRNFLVGTGAMGAVELLRLSPSLLLCWDLPSYCFRGSKAGFTSSL
jgi:hypothetical protein